jgi:hypothetical protein
MAFLAANINDLILDKSDTRGPGTDHEAPLVDEVYALTVRWQAATACGRPHVEVVQVSGARFVVAQQSGASPGASQGGERTAIVAAASTPDAELASFVTERVERAVTVSSRGAFAALFAVLLLLSLGGASIVAGIRVALAGVPGGIIGGLIAGGCVVQVAALVALRALLRSAAAKHKHLLMAALADANETVLGRRELSNAPVLVGWGGASPAGSSLVAVARFGPIEQSTMVGSWGLLWHVPAVTLHVVRVFGGAASVPALHEANDLAVLRADAVVALGGSFFYVGLVGLLLAYLADLLLPAAIMAPLPGSVRNLRQRYVQLVGGQRGAAQP